jgi:ABC-type uncharacterized transport system YnjBCD ATPase subunit
VKSKLPRSWLEDGERDLGLDGEAFLQGMVAADASGSKHVVASERRVVMIDGAHEAGGILFQVPWTSVWGYWLGVLGFPPELWREGPEGDVAVLMLDPEASDGQDVVIRSNVASWVTAIRALGIPEIID